MKTFKDYLSQSILSDEDYQAALKACNFSDEGQVKDLITATFTPHAFNNVVAEKHFKANGNYDYFTNFFGTEVWEDGQGQDEFREAYYAPNIGYDFSMFIRTMQVCDAATADECRTTYMDLPEGGRGALPPMEMYKWGVKTPRQCIANMRHIRAFREWGKKLMEGWYGIDQQIMNMFYMFAAMRLAGHKVLLQGYRDPAGGVYPVANMDPKNPFGGFLHSYQEPMFPSVQNPDLIVPLEYQYLEQVARFWTHAGSDNHIGVGERGENIYEFWYPEDWYRQYAIRNPEFFEGLKRTMPAKFLQGYSTSNAKDSMKEVLGNWSMRVMPVLPRFTESTEGGLIPIDNFLTEDVEVGQRSIFAGRDYLNAPFLMAISPSPKAGKILYRPDLTTSVEGWPIQPIMGRGGWKVRNDYDKECNEDMNMPYSQRRYEVGMRMDDPDASMAVIFRNTIVRLLAANECEWAPVTQKAPIRHDDFQAACGTNARRAPQHVTEKGFDGAVYIECDAHVCGKGDGLTHRLKFTRKVDNPGYLPFKNCVCGDTIKLGVVDEDGETTMVNGLVIDTAAAYGSWPESLLWVELEDTLEPGSCIKYAMCEEDEEEDNAELPFVLPDGGLLVVNCNAGEDGVLSLIINDTVPDGYEVDDAVNIKRYNADGTSAGADITGFTITSISPTRDFVVLTHEDGDEYEGGCPTSEYIVVV
jgi:hypothetical protein